MLIGDISLTEISPPLRQAEEILGRPINVTVYQRADVIKKLKTEVEAYKAPAVAYKKLAGTYSNKVYGKITIEAKDGFGEVSFEFHPQYKGKIRFKNSSTMIIEYNDASSLGLKEIKVSDTTIEIKVTDFVDMDTYLFTKI